VGWFARPHVGRGTGGTTMGDDHEAWAKVAPTSPEYATAQRLLGYNYYAHDRHDFAEAKRHVDLALAASPDDPKVLEDAGRVYVLAGLTEQGTEMLKRADTPVAREFLAQR
jgi:Flp pilus assembly protein TadD